jgi:hypothetical protein
MNAIDQKKRAAFQCDAVAGEINLAKEVRSAFRGRYRWLPTLMFAVNLVVFTGLLFAAMRFFDPAAFVMELRWGGMALSLLLVLVVTMLKLWLWVETHINSIAPLL